MRENKQFRDSFGYPIKIYIRSKFLEDYVEIFDYFRFIKKKGQRNIIQQEQSLLQRNIANIVFDNHTSMKQLLDTCLQGSPNKLRLNIRESIANEKNNTHISGFYSKDSRKVSSSLWEERTQKIKQIQDIQFDRKKLILERETSLNLVEILNKQMDESSFDKFDTCEDFKLTSKSKEQTLQEKRRKKKQMKKLLGWNESFNKFKEKEKYENEQSNLQLQQEIKRQFSFSQVISNNTSLCPKRKRNNSSYFASMNYKNQKLLGLLSSEKVDNTSNLEINQKNSKKLQSLLSPEKIEKGENIQNFGIHLRNTQKPSRLFSPEKGDNTLNFTINSKNSQKLLRLFPYEKGESLAMKNSQKEESIFLPLKVSNTQKIEYNEQQNTIKTGNFSNVENENHTVSSKTFDFGFKRNYSTGSKSNGKTPHLNLIEPLNFNSLTTQASEGSKQQKIRMRTPQKFKLRDFNESQNNTTTDHFVNSNANTQAASPSSLKLGQCQQIIFLQQAQKTREGYFPHKISRAFREQYQKTLSQKQNNNTLQFIGSNEFDLLRSMFFNDNNLTQQDLRFSAANFKRKNPLTKTPLFRM